MPSGHATNITTTPQGATKAVYLTDQDCDLILEGVRSGLPVEFACSQAGTSATQFRMRRRRDPLLQQRFEHAHAEGRESYVSLIEKEVFHQAFELKNWKALEKLAMVHLPEWAVLRTQRYEVDHQVTGEIQHRLAQYTKEELETIRRLELEKLEQHPVLELPDKTAA